MQTLGNRHGDTLFAVKNWLNTDSLIPNILQIKQKRSLMNKKIIQLYKQLFSDICQIIDTAKIRVAVKANTELTLMYWHIGRRLILMCLETNGQNTGNKLC